MNRRMKMAERSRREKDGHPDTSTEQREVMEEVRQSTDRGFVNGDDVGGPNLDESMDFEHLSD